MKLFNKKYRFEECNHLIEKTEEGVCDLMLLFLKHLKDFHLKDFNHVCDVNNVYGISRVELSYMLDILVKQNNSSGGLHE